MSFRTVRVAAVVALIALAAACTTSSSPKSSPTSPASGGGTTSGALTATAKGVTATTIKIGFSYIDLETLAKAGIIKIDHGPYAEIIKALVGDVNARGGINGRKLELFTAKYSPIGNTDQLTACTKLTEDDGVFAVLDGLLQDNNLCIVQQHSTILVGGNFDAALHAKARAPWATWNASDDRSVTALVQLMDRNGYLKGHTVAVYAQNSVYKPLIDEAVQALRAVGTKAVDTAVFDVQGGDTQAASANDKVFANRFHDKGVDTVIDVGLFTPVVDWDNDGFHPAIFEPNAGNIAAAAYTNPGVFVKFPLVGGLQGSADPNDGFNTPEAAHCRAVWKQATGKDILDQAGENKLGHSTGGAAMAEACTAMQIFVAAAKAAGPDLTPQTWQTALESIGKIALPTGSVASFGTGKPDGQDSFVLAKQDPTWTPKSTAPEFIAIGEPITLTH